MPAAQAVQPYVVLSSIWYVDPWYPVLHMHSLPSDEYEFGGHGWQVSMEVAPCACEYWPARHFVHASEPRIVLYVPEAQDVHGCDPSKPALHRHARSEILPAGELLFQAHAVHSAEPVIILYVPAAQAAHVAPV